MQTLGGLYVGKVLAAWGWVLLWPELHEGGGLIRESREEESSKNDQRLERRHWPGKPKCVGVGCILVERRGNRWRSSSPQVLTGL